MDGQGLGGKGIGVPDPVTLPLFGFEGLVSLFEEKVNSIRSGVDAMLDEVKTSEGVDGFSDCIEEWEIQREVLILSGGGQGTVNENTKEGLFFSQVARQATLDVGELFTMEVARVEAMFEGILVGGLSAGFPFGGGSVWVISHRGQLLVVRSQ
jgi:hypothetical protein